MQARNKAGVVVSVDEATLSRLGPEWSRVEDPKPEPKPAPKRPAAKK